MIFSKDADYTTNYTLDTMQAKTAEKRKHTRYAAQETLCAVFDSGTFGQLVDISKIGLSVLVIGSTMPTETSVVNVFQLSGASVISNVSCTLVRQETVRVSKNRMKNNYQLYCLQIDHHPPYFREQFNSFLSSQSMEII